MPGRVGQSLLDVAQMHDVSWFACLCVLLVVCQ